MVSYESADRALEKKETLPDWRKPLTVPPGWEKDGWRVETRGGMEMLVAPPLDGDTPSDR